MRAVQYTDHEGPKVLSVIQTRALQSGSADGATSYMISIDESTLCVVAQRREEAIVQCPGRPDNAEFPAW